MKGSAGEGIAGAPTVSRTWNSSTATAPASPSTPDRPQCAVSTRPALAEFSQAVLSLRVHVPAINVASTGSHDPRAPYVPASLACGSAVG
ncbi:hypothetical protein [Amycolatopsis alba]|uniref:hypothetical protein n=1 Tax=Amycolatopsis alba TaxID=76020 RepID=UPI0003A9324B|nr:hypothetical protein [Amycolatopsis alba]